MKDRTLIPTKFGGLKTSCCKVAPMMYKSTNRILCSKCGESIPNVGLYRAADFPQHLVYSPAEAAVAAATRSKVTAGAREVKAVKPRKPLPGQRKLL